MERYALTVQRIGLVAIANLLIALSGIILLPVLTKTLPITSYGSWALVVATISLLPVITSLGLRQTMIRFLAASKDKHDIQEVFYSLAFVVFVAALVVSGPFFIFAHLIAASLFDNNVAAALIFPLNVFVACLNLFIVDFFRAFQQAKKYSALIFLQAYVQVALVSLFVLLGYGLLGAVLGLLLEQLFVLFVTTYLIIIQIGFAFPKFVHTREHLAFGLPLMPGDLSFWITNSSDRYLIGILLGVAAVGYYSPAYTLGSAITVVSSALTVLLPSVLAKHYDEDNIGEVRTIMKYSLKYYAGIAIPCAFAVSVLSRPLLTILSTEQIAANGYLVTPFVAAGALLLGAYTFFVTVLTLQKKTAVVGTIWALSAALNFGANLILIPHFGIIGAAFTTFIAFLLAFVLTAVHSLRRFKFDVSSSFVLKSACASIVICAFLLLWNPAGLVSVLLAISLAAAIYLGILFVLRGFTIEEIKFFYSIFKVLLKSAD